MSFDLYPEMAADEAASMAGVATALPLLGYGQSYFRTARAAVNKTRKVYNRPLSHIPACAEAFEESWANNRGYARFGFRTQEKFQGWISTMRGVLARYERHRLTGSWQDAPDDGASSRVAGFVKDEAHDLGIVSWCAFMPFSTFAGVAAEDEVTLAVADGAWIARAAARLGYERRKSFLRGLDVFNKLIASPEAQAALPGLLSAATIAPPPRRAPRGRYDGFLPAEIPPTVRADFDHWLDRKRNGDFDERLSEEDDKTNITDSSAAAYGYAVGWLWRNLVAAERIDPDEVDDLADLLTYRNIFDAARLFQELRADPASGLKPDAGSLHSYVSKTTQIATEHCGISPADSEKMRKLRKHRLVRTASVANMASQREKWLGDLAHDASLQRRLLSLPELLMELGRAILARWDDLAGVGRRVERMRGLKLGVAAAQAAILFYGKPIRATNLRTLRIWCDDQNLVLPEGRARTVLLSIPGEEVKNGKPIEGELDPEAWPVLRWYLEEVRPKLIKSHPFGKNYADSAFLFPSPRRDRPMEKSVFSAAFIDAGQAAGIDMTLHLARHVTVFFLLDEDPNAWAEASEMLDDDEMTVRKRYAFMSKHKTHQSARAKLRRARTGRLRGQF